MEILVVKFGGMSVSTPESFSKVAQIVSERAKEYSQIVVVVSAMGDMTEELFQLAHKVHPNPAKRELDMLVSAGERISVSLLAMALQALGKEAISFTGSQSGIITCARHSEARIVEVRPHRLLPHLRENKVVVVAGFQGVGLNGEITTLGRGGSDTSAVALAIALEAEKVEFYKDVEGIYSEDPKKNPEAKKFLEMTYDEALCLLQGDGVLHKRAVQLAKENQVPLQVLSYETFSSNKELVNQGTFIGEKKEKSPPVFEMEFEEKKQKICL